MGNTVGNDKISFFFLILIYAACLTANKEKKVSGEEVLSPKQIADLDADFIIGGLFPVHVIEKNTSKCENGKDKRYTYMSPVFGEKYCYRINLSGLMWIEAMLFAINEINNSTDILAGKKLGYVINDSGNSAQIALNATLDYIYNTEHVVNSSANETCSCTKPGRRITALIGGAGSKISRTVSYILGVDNIPQISYSSTSPSLSNKLYFPSFLRTIPSDLMQAEVMADLVAYYNWTYVSTVATDEDYGRFGIQAFKKAIKSRNICISVDELFHSDIRLPETKAKISEIVRKLKKDQTAKVVVLFSESPSALAVIEEAQRLGLKGKIWIGTEAWGDQSDVLPFNEEVIGGMLGVLPWKGKIEKFEHYMASLTPLNTSHNPWFLDYWKGYFGCNFEEEDYDKTSSSSNETLLNSNSSQLTLGEARSFSGSDKTSEPKIICSTKSLKQDEKANVQEKMTNNKHKKTITCSKCIHGTNPTAAEIQLNKSPNVMDAVYSVALALNKMLNCKEPNGLLPDGKCPTIQNGTQVIPNQLLTYIKNLSYVQNLGYLVEFDRNGDTKGNYVIKSLQPDKNAEYGKRFVTIGHWEWSSRKLFIQRNASIKWNGWSDEVPGSQCSAACGIGYYPVREDTPCCWKCVKCPMGTFKNSSGQTKCLTCDVGYMSNENRSNCFKIPEVYLQWRSTTCTVILLISSLGLISTLFVIFVFSKYRNTAVVKASSREFSILLLCLLICMFCLPVMYTGRPTDLMCRAQPICLGFILTFWTSLMLTKTNRLLMIFNSKSAGRDRKLLDIRFQLFLAVLLTLLLTCITVVYMVMFPIKVHRTYYDTKVLVGCGANATLLLMLILGYTAVLAITCTYLAYKAKSLPANFNETRYIGFTMFTFCVILIVLVPCYYYSGTELNNALLCFALDMTGFGILIGMFTTKVRIILFQPQKNKTEVVRAKMFSYTIKNRSNSSLHTLPSTELSRRTSVVTIGGTSQFTC